MTSSLKDQLLERQQNMTEARESFAKTNDDVTEEVGDFLSNTMCDFTKEK